MKLPGLKRIVTGSSAALMRFPLVLLSAAVAVISMIWITEADLDQPQIAARFFSLFMVSLLGIPFFLALKLTGERRGWSGMVQLGIRLAGVAALAGYFFLLPDNFDTAPAEYLYRYALFLLAAHLLVAVGPFWSRGEMSPFWHYNKTLFLRFLTAVLFSAVLYIGLTIAMVSTDELLGADIEGERYLHLFLIIGGIFNTWFFLSGIPNPIDRPGAHREYPRGLKIFTQYILIPLVAIYVIILYLYTGKVIVEWTWPEGLVAYLVLSFSIAGIFALLLLHPIQEKVENRWIKTFSRSYFWLLVPLVILLLLAIWRRIWEYSFTVNRYFVLVLGLWLAGIVIYFIVSRAKNIKVIPASLAVLAVLISFGPWGAFSVSERSQANRLEQYLQKHEILQEGTIHQASGPVPAGDRQEISSIIRYLNSTHGLTRLQPWFEEDLSTLTGDSPGDTFKMNRVEIPRYLTDRMGIEYVNEWGGTEVPAYERQYFSEGQNILPLDEYEWLVRYRFEGFNPDDSRLQLGDTAISIRTSPTGSTVTIRTDSEPADTLQIDLKPLINELGNRHVTSQAYGIPLDEMTVTVSDGSFNARLYLSNLAVRRQDGEITLLSLEGDLLLRMNGGNN